MRIKMEQKNILNITTREDFRKWLIQNHNTESECWMAAKEVRIHQRTVYGI